MAERQKTPRGTMMTLIALGVVIGLMLSGTAMAASYLTKAKANKLYLNNSKTYVETGFTVGTNASDTQTVNCPAGWQALGGGVQPNSLTNTNLTVRYSAPVVNGDNLVAAADGQNPKSTGWTVRVANSSGVSSFTYAVGVICSK
jgi:hypothetical protein